MKEQRQIFVIFGWVIILFLGCAPRITFIPVMPEPTSINIAAELPVYTSQHPPVRPFRVIGTLFVDEAIDFWNVHRLTDSALIQQLTAAAQKHGAQAIWIGELQTDIKLFPGVITFPDIKVTFNKHAVAYAIIFDTIIPHSEKRR